MGVNFIKKHKILVISKNCKICSGLRIAYSNQKKAWLLEGRVGGWVEAKAGLRIAYSNQKSSF